MRKKRMILVLAVALFFVVLLTGLFILSPFKMSTGIFIAADSPFILFDGGSGEPVVLLSGTGNRDIFKNLQTGDRVLILHNGTMMLSYPAQMNVFFCIRLKKGDMSNVPEETIETLKEMGWLEEKAFGQNQ